MCFLLRFITFCISVAGKQSLLYGWQKKQEYPQWFTITYAMHTISKKTPATFCHIYRDLLSLCHKFIEHTP